MGVDRNMKLGAYIELQLEKEEGDVNVRFCINHPNKSVNYDQTFCSVCGTKICNRTEKVMTFPDIYDVLEDLDIDCDRFHIMISNYNTSYDKIGQVFLSSNKQGYSMIVDEENTVDIEVTPFDINQKIDDFEEEYAVEIAKLVDGFPQEPEIKFGFLQWFN